MSDAREIFRSPDVLARWRGGFGDGLCVVTFSSYTYDHAVDRAGFGEAFFLKEKVDAIHVVTGENRWYDMPELEALLRAIRDETRGYTAVATYGSSMGGFAALHFAGHVGARIAIAISPQYAVDRAHAPFETRWRKEARKLRFPSVESRPAPTQYLFYDPRHPIDRRHAACFRAHGPVTELHVRHGGHPVGAILDQTQLLKDAVRQCLKGTFAPPAFLKLLRPKRRQSSQYLWTLARALPDHRMTTKLALARMALDAQRTDHSLRYLASLLVKTGKAADAEALLREAAAMPGADIHACVDLVQLLEATGRRREARRMLFDLNMMHPGNALIAKAFLLHFMGFLRHFSLFRKPA